MAFTQKNVVAEAQLSNSWATLYTSPANTKATVTLASFYNTNTTAEKVELRLVKSGSTPAAANKIDEKTLAADEAWRPNVAHVLEAGDYIQGQSTTADKVNVWLSAILNT